MQPLSVHTSFPANNSFSETGASCVRMRLLVKKAAADVFSPLACPDLGGRTLSRAARELLSQVAYLLAHARCEKNRMPSIFRQCAFVLLIYCFSALPSLAQISVPAGASIDVPVGSTLDAACGGVDVQGQLNVTSGQLRTGGDLVIGSSGVLNGNDGVVRVGGNLRSTGSFNAGNSTVELVDGCVGNTTQISGNLVFQNLVLRSGSGRAFAIQAGSQITVLGTLTLQGVSGQNLQLVSANGGAVVVNLGPSANVVSNFVSVASNVQIGTAAATAKSIPTLSEYGVLILGSLLALVAWALQPSLLANRVYKKKVCL